MTVNRRRFLQAATTGATVLAAGTLGAPPALAAPGGFPDYRYVRTLLRPDQLGYDPTGEIIFPCVRGVYDRLSSPIGRYYLYYAPHNDPGGICLAYGDSLEGPFTEYPGNPIVANRWDPHYSVPHVSSPHVMWHAGQREMWLYFHGDNRTTRLARSADGIHFTYDKIVLSTSMLPAGATEASYARVFPYNLPSRGARYVMVFMRNITADRRNISWGWSADGRNWQFDPTPLVEPQAVGAVNLSGPHLLERNGNAYVVYHTDKGSGGNILITEVGADFSRRRHLGVFYDSRSAAPESGRAAAPCFGTDRGVPYMIYEAGERLGGVIAMARG
ncbi:twin-arginine translocation signal domain-containing protein [Actinoalloteichus fjordicus]|uniref:Secreted protein n=1 Tax=Actinoalloteichus fjordicus TaxID=1612552 RepID=A0AAC9LES3_9PSEU|nr:twin-arginine translocation signal domain-containing protein [Actinoalloteichus fjordicus]APU15422.1 hypothetical protein UA74_16960 [Actinoalloteichus fjordicus]